MTEKKVTKVMPVFDRSKLFFCPQIADYRINYGIFLDPTMSARRSRKMITAKKLKHAFNHNHACFADLPGMFRSFTTTHKEPANRVIYETNFKANKNKEYQLSTEEISKWTTLCKRHRLFPSYIGAYFVSTGNFVVFLEGLDLNTLYVYLCAARYCSDEPYIVKMLLYFIEQHDMDFFLALLLATAIGGYGIGHSILPISRLDSLNTRYKTVDDNSVEMAHVPLSIARSLRKFLYGANAKETKLMDILKKDPKTHFGFRLHEKLGYSYGSSGSDHVLTTELLKPESVKKIYKD